MNIVPTVRMTRTAAAVEGSKSEVNLVKPHTRSVLYRISLPKLDVNKLDNYQNRL